MDENMIRPTAEAKYFLSTNLAAGATSAAGALSIVPTEAGLSPEAALALYLYTTAAVGVTTCAALSLVCRSTDDSMRVVVGRFLMSVMLTIFCTRVVMEWFSKWPSADILNIGTYAISTCIIAYTVGHSTITYLAKHPSKFRDAILNLLLRNLDLKEKEPPK